MNNNDFCKYINLMAIGTILATVMIAATFLLHQSNNRVQDALTLESK
jgi:hypothetical protein